jgi:hypothetical protein
MKRERFTKQEAETKIGKVIRSNAEFSGVPEGSTGRVVKADNMGDVDNTGEDEWNAVIEWDLPQRGKPVQDWFTKDEYERYLEEL